ncbi:penicillin acylase family protein [Kribbella sandramycini]|uniref:Penicillin acylase family protein n=1 Tax=Kribbella sandramycini TaxID=60450 RepID=A0A7Y4L2C1_9ACTN|nr:penicillin amidase [Kribbella sandramycini]NOL43063.1 penicillin acylase family protein [Kribbella sandramycini]
MNGEVFRDAYGVPHLRAGDHLALAELQGAVTARDRAWQLELIRRRALGSTAAFLGPDAVPWDTFARQARLADTAQRCYAALDDTTRAWVSAYVDGVNSALPAASEQAPEFAQTGVTVQKWEPWTPLAIWLAVHILFAGFPNKLWRTHVAARLGEEYLDLFNAAGPQTAGSNGWVIPGDFTATGQAIVAGDPHRFVESPGVYQQIRLACPAYDVVGFGVPGVPGVAHFGHAGKVAWAITNAQSDYQDLYAEQLRRSGTTIEALGPGGWEPATRHDEVIEVAGADPVAIEVIETERGPIVVDHAGQTLSLRYPPRALGRLGFEVMPRLLQATTAADIDAALEDWVEPVNVVFAADAEGGLLHRVAGVVPQRHAANSLRVVPGWEAAYAWDGWHPMPRATVEGPEAMANAREIAAPLGVEFAAPYRARRIRELLAERADWSIDDMADIHTDTYLGAAYRLLDRLPGLTGLSPKAVALRTELLAWDRRMDAGSTTASAYAALRKAAIARITERFALLDNADAPPLFAGYFGLLSQVSFGFESLLESPDLDATALVQAALESVAADNPRPPWGETHQLSPLSALRTPLFTPTETPIDLALSGDHNCVWSTSSLPGTDLCLRASVARYAFDLTNRANSRWIVPLGASGLPGHPHHHDQLPLWLRGHLAPIVTDWDQLKPEV